MKTPIQTSDTKRLFEKLCQLEILHEGYKAVRKNKGAPGIDGIAVDMYGSRLNEELGELKKELESWTYRPKPVRGVEIPKPLGGVRQLGIPCVRDRVVQASLKLLLEPILDPTFSDHSYGFRPGRNQVQAVKSAEALVRSGKKFVVDIDLAKFFDRIHHDRLISRLGLFIADKRILRLVGLTLRSGVMKNGLVTVSREGSVQGSPISPLLSNVVLDELDKELERRKLTFCRFADDCNIFVGSQAAADRVMKAISQYIEEHLKLAVNREKSHTGESQQVKFLGMTILGKAGMAISAQSMVKAMEKVSELTPRGTHLTMEKSIVKINQWYRGWSNYYGMTRFPFQLNLIEMHIRRRLRARIVVQHKRRRNLYDKLRKRGISHRTAAVVYANKRTWALSISRAMHFAYPNKYFARQGLYAIAERGDSHWYPIGRKPTLK